MASASEPRVLRTSIGDLPLAQVELIVADRAWRVFHSGAIVTSDDEQRFLGAEVRLPYGIVLWPAGIALAHEVGERAFAGKKVLELGAGTGLPGMVAASKGATVVQTDNQEVALHLAMLNAEANGVTGMEHRSGDWTAWADDARYDVILGSDVLYGTTLHGHLRHIFETNLAPGGVVLLSDPFRKASFPLFEAMAADGWDVAMNKWTVGVTPPPRSVGVFALRRS